MRLLQICAPLLLVGIGFGQCTPSVTATGTYLCGPVSVGYPAAPSNNDVIYLVDFGQPPSPPQGLPANTPFIGLTVKNGVPMYTTDGKTILPLVGSNGVAATVSIGTVSSGTTAQVSNSGTSTNAVLNFVIPAGAVGPAGPAWNPMGHTITVSGTINCAPAYKKSVPTGFPCAFTNATLTVTGFQ